MTSSIDVQFGEKVLEIGTGSGYQSAYLSNLTDKVWSIEIIKPLADRTRGVYDGLIARGYGEFKDNSSSYLHSPRVCPTTRRSTSRKCRRTRTSVCTWTVTAPSG
jgi:hypothetical protein